jgi:Fe-S-cluster containining protein
MKYIDLDKLKDLPGRRIKNNDTFSFRCYPGIGCYNLCCRNLNLFLYPYDVLRLKSTLDISSDEFLDQYVDVVLRSDNYFPEVLLRMSESKEKTCPFLVDAGCSIYADRPDTCRTFPIEQGILYDAVRKKDAALHFFRPPNFCIGQHEDQQWTVATWSRDQDAERYHRMTIQGPRAKMAFMATYNIDRFREFVFNSSFLKRYKVKSVILKKIKQDDGALLTFGFDWIKFYIWDIKTKKIRPR